MNEITTMKIAEHLRDSIDVYNDMFEEDPILEAEPPAAHTKALASLAVKGGGRAFRVLVFETLNDDS